MKSRSVSEISKVSLTYLHSLLSTFPSPPATPSILSHIQPQDSYACQPFSPLSTICQHYSHSPHPAYDHEPLLGILTAISMSSLISPISIHNYLRSGWKYVTRIAERREPRSPPSSMPKDWPQMKYAVMQPSQEGRAL